VTAAECLNLMLDHWNERGDDHWTPEKLKLKVDHAYRYGSQAPGAAAPEVEFDLLVDAPKEMEEHYLHRLNKEYALILMGGSHFILHETVDEKGRPQTQY